MRVKPMKDPAHYGTMLLEAALPIVEGEPSEVDARILYGSALLFSTSILDEVRLRMESDNKHAAAKTVLECMRYLTNTAMVWSDEAEELEVTP